MKILSIETSCDETAVSLVEATGGLEAPSFVVLGNSLYSQVELHKEFGGVFPMLAKREHGKNLVPLLMQTLRQANVSKAPFDNPTKENVWEKIQKITEKEDGLFEKIKEALEHFEKPNIDMIAVTAGPGLEPALWVGISFALALGMLWDVPVVGTNHMEGHIASVLLNQNSPRFDLKNGAQGRTLVNSIQFPALALLISGGHTELVEVKNWGEYKVIGETRDDAVGEAFDKVARLLGLPYPGGPEISKLAECARNENLPETARLPRPMIHSGDLTFSFSGLKTAVLYYIRNNFKNENQELSEKNKMDIAREFEDAVVDVLLAKTKQALDENGAQTLIIAGGVIANKKIRETFQSLEQTYPGLRVLVPERDLATDNALMIAAAAYLEITLHPELLSPPQPTITAKGNLRLGQ